ncbi:hypothetical protein Patl1_01941 [Pistacia atlantica]|uniref:Uncharacterized protein n=1 Tax=Pistacia atlantica TaxID=434234 RepID=A0ACC1C5G2_9ROSI|nr:hypothetical protein Patl1_01941 [Pistacia atlantica]
MQSDLDIASTSLSNHLRDIDLLLRSGVLYQSNAIVLSQPGPASDKEDLVLFIKDLFTRLQIGGVEFKKKALESLLQLLIDDEKSACLVAKEGNIGYLITLLDFHHQGSIREQAVLGLSIVVSASDESRKIVFEEAYGGVSVLMEACRSGSVATQTHAVGAIRNIVAVEDIQTTLAEEGAVPVLVELMASDSNSAKENAAHCIATLASSGEYFRVLIIRERGLQRLMHLIQDSSVKFSYSRKLFSCNQFTFFIRFRGKNLVIFNLIYNPTGGICQEGEHVITANFVFIDW